MDEPKENKPEELAETPASVETPEPTEAPVSEPETPVSEPEKPAEEPKAETPKADESAEKAELASAETSAEAPAEKPAETPVEKPAETPTVNLPTDANASREKTNIFKFMLNAVMKPVTTFKEQLEKIDIKNALIIALIVSVFGTILSTVSMVSKTILVEECTENCSLFSSGERKYSTKMEWKNLDNVDMFEYLMKSFAYYALTILAVAGIYYGLTLIFKKKDAKFNRYLGIAAVAMLPMYVCTFLAPILGGVSTELGGVINLAGIAYAFLIIIIGMTEESKVEGNAKVFYHLAAAFLIALALYLIMRLLYGEAIATVFKLLLGISYGNLDLSKSTSLFSF